MNDLTKMNCTEPKKGDPHITSAEIEEYYPQIPEWAIVEVEGVKQLTRQYSFPNFVSALEFTNKIGDLADAEDHHPSILTEWGKVTLTWWTHVVKGLHLNDFITAAKSDEIYSK